MARRPLCPVVVAGFLAVFTTVAEPAFGCGLDWILPGNHFDGVNERGAVSVWQQVDTVDLGGDLKLPLIVNFRSDRNSVSPYLGSGWLFALLESQIYQINERTFLMVQPDGLNRYFYRLQPEDTVLKEKGGWAAEINGDTIKAWAACGWKLTFVKGRLVTMQTPENRKLEFVYTGGQVSEIREGNKSYLKVLSDSNGHTAGIEFNDRRIGIQLDNRPMVQKLGARNMVASLSPSLRKFTGQQGEQNDYTFSVDENIYPTLKITGKTDRLFTWDPASQRIISDTGWKYMVHPAEGVFAYAAIQREGPKGESESWFNDIYRGVETSQGANGVKTVITRFVNGAAAGKLRKIEEIAKGKTTILDDLAYDENGKLLQETDSSGVVTTFKYDERGRISDVVRNGQLFASRKYDDKNRVVEEVVAGDHKETYKYGKDGGVEKTSVAVSGEKTVEILDKDEKLVSASYPDGRGIAATGNDDSIELPQTTGNRDAQAVALMNDLGQAKTPGDRCSLLLRIGGLYIDDTLGPVDAASAIKIYERILNDATMDVYSKAQADMQVVTACLNMNDPKQANARAHMEALLSLNPAGLEPGRQKAFEDIRAQAFRMLLSLMRTKNPSENEKMWREALEKYGSSDSFKQQFDYVMAEQKRGLAMKYFYSEQ